MKLITGGTGLIGSHLLLYHARKGEKVRATYRQKESIKKTKKVFDAYSVDSTSLFNQIEWVKADITDINSLETIFDNITQVFHVAAMVSFNKKDKEKLMSINVEGTENLLHMAQEAKVKKFLHVSSIAALGAYEQPITEKTHWNWKEKHSDYGISKYLSEMEVWRAGQEGMPVVIINPSIIIGAHFWKSGFGTLINKIENGLKYYPPGGNGFVDVWDVVKIMYDLMDSSIENESFIVSSYNKSYYEVLSSMAKALAIKPPQKILSKKLAYLIYLIGKIPKSMLHTWYNYPQYSSEKLESVLNHTPIPFEKSIQNLIAQYQKFR